MLKPNVTLIGYTTFVPEAAIEATDFRYSVDSADPESGAELVQFAGRACYQSWDRPNPATATTQGYMSHILDVKHYSILRHASASFYVQGVSRSFTHEMVTHAHIARSQLSQRFVVQDAGGYITPPLFQNDETAAAILQNQWVLAVNAYDALLARGEKIARDRGLTGTAAKKQAREAARAVLPNMTPTAIVLTGNHQAWREMLEKRCAYPADAEMRVVTALIFERLSNLEPELYLGLSLKYDADGYPFLVNKPTGE